MKQEENNTNVIFAAKLREAMDRLAFTQNQLAAAASVTQGAVSLYLKGRVPNGEGLVALAIALGTTSEALLGKSPMVLQDNAGWKQRALSAEQRLEAVKAGLAALLKKI